MRDKLNQLTGPIQFSFVSASKVTFSSCLALAAEMRPFDSGARIEMMRLSLVPTPSIAFLSIRASKSTSGVKV